MAETEALLTFKTEDGEEKHDLLDLNDFLMIR